MNKSDKIRRKLTHFLTGGLKDSEDQTMTPFKKEEIKKILIIRTNHRLGNMLFVTSLVQEVETVFPEATIDLFVKGGAAHLVFQNYPPISRIYGLPKKTFKQFFSYLEGWLKLKSHRYDLVINATYTSSSGRLATKLSKASYKSFGMINLKNNDSSLDYLHEAKSQVLSFRRFLTKSGLKSPNEAIPLMDLRLNTKELEEGEFILNKMVGNDRKTISIFTFATGEKCLSREWWLPFFSTLKEQFPDYNILEILPVENVSQIDFKAPSFYSKDIRAIGGVIAATEVFIGADSGIMHVASAAKTPTVGLFSVTAGEKYGPFGNGSVSVKVEDQNFKDCIRAVKRILKDGIKPSSP